jgi:carboxyl-terminal processing protease
MNKSNFSKILPLLLMLFLAIGVYVGSQMNIGDSLEHIFSIKYTDKEKINDVLNLITNDYVDDVSQGDLTEKTIEGLLQSLDPHSSYIPPQDLDELEESMHGKFFGIGVQFRQWHDTVVVIKVIDGGPSKKAGILAGDRLVSANGISLIGIANDSIMGLLKGPINTKVMVGIRRNETKENLKITIIRGIIPMESVVAAYLVNDSTAYVKVDRFAENTTKEFRKAIMNLGYDNVKAIIVDLQDNGGGLLNTAISLTDEFLPEGKTIVYTQGRKRKKEVAISTAQEMFQGKKVVVLVNESSASASEIFAGAIQDNDRGYIIGRRTFGKGLVQEQINLPDKSAIRLTVARYYTATGRCIQKPYDEGTTSYYHEISSRYKHGEMVNSDSAIFNDSLKYITKGGRTVYGGGGIMPDIYVPVDTTINFWFYNMLQANGIINEFVFEYYDSHRRVLLKKYKTDYEFIKYFKIDSEMMTGLVKESKKAGIEWPPNLSPTIINEIKVFMKARLASDLYGNSSLYKVLNQRDKTYLKAIEFLKTYPSLEV